jgi:uncharacterized protein YdhG (YjbR/CyaY superfamily)
MQDKCVAKLGISARLNRICAARTSDETANRKLYLSFTATAPNTMTAKASGNSPYGSRKYQDIDDYHSAQEPFIKERLAMLRAAIHAAVPGLTETISYNMPTFRLRTNLVYYAVHKNHIGFYPTSGPLKAFAHNLEKFKHSKGAVQFPHSGPLPLELVRDMVQFRATEDLSKLKD